MSALTNRPRWTVEEFFAWQEEQEERYELVDGYPQPHRLMTGALNGHDDVVVNIIAALKDRLRGKPCRPFTADGSVRTKIDQIRRPDVGVDRGPRDPKERQAANPTVVFEVFSASTRTIDLVTKLGEYRNLNAIRHIVFVEPGSPMILHWFKTAENVWSDETLKGLDAAIDLGAIEVSLPMSAIYDGVSLD